MSTTSIMATTSITAIIITNDGYDAGGSGGDQGAGGDVQVVGSTDAGTGADSGAVWG